LLYIEINAKLIINKNVIKSKRNIFKQKFIVFNRQGNVMAGLQALQKLIQPIVALIANIANSQPNSPDSLTSAAWYNF
jgi:hypothetical protein